MKKNYIITVVIIFTVLATAGCSLSGKQNNENKNENAEETQTQNQHSIRQGMQTNEQRMLENFEEVLFSDLIVGSSVLVTGSSNSDGSISADRIIIGGSEENFEGAAGPMMQRGNNGGREDRPMPSFSGNERPNFQNMTEEERANIMKMTRERGMTRQTDFSRSMTRANGEIIEKDEQTITLKLDDGGSKLIFFSDKTKIMKVKK